MQNSRGLTRAKEIYRNRDRRVRELKDQGKKIVGYVCCYPTLELMTAAGCVPYRVMGKATEPITEADTYLETILCGFIRSCFDTGIKGQLDFLDGLVSPHSCDTVEKVFDIWRYYLKPPYSFFLDVPHMTHPASYIFFAAQLHSFQKSLEGLSGAKITPQGLREAIRLHNHHRALMRELYGLRKEDPPLLTGTEMTEVIIAAMSLPVEESSALLTEVIREVKQRQEPPPRRKARLLIWGGPMDNTALVQLIEQSGANVVMDDTCIGSRHYWADVESDPEPLEALTRRYLDKIVCPRTYRDSPGNHQADIENRFGYLRDFARDFKVNGAILQVIRFCDIHEYDAPDVRDYLKECGLPVLFIEHDYSAAALAPLATRIQAFLEMIG